MVRKIVFAAICITAALASASCGGSGSDPTQSVIKLQAFGDPAEIDAYKELIAAFERENKDVRVQFIPVGKQKDHMAKLTTSFVGGDAPDLFLINFRRFGQFAEKAVLEPLGPRIFERGKIKREDLYEQTVEAFTYNDTVSCIPQNVSSLVVYYNRKLFEEAGVPFPKDDWLWKDFSAAVLKLTRDVDGDRKTDVYGLAFEPYLIRIAPFIWQNGGEIVDDLNKPTKLTLDGPTAGTALKFLKTLGSYGAVPPQAEAMTEDADARFARGGVAMLLQSRRYTATLRPIKGLDWDVAPLPMRRKKHTALHSDAYCMAKDSKQKDAAYRFVEYALSPAGAEILARSGRTVPAVKSIAESPVFLDPTQRPESARVFLDSIPTLRRTPNTAEWNEVETRVDALLEEWFYEPVVGDPDAGKPIGLILQYATKDLFKEASR
jgi:multiple sugar transport system substrate-binding protein